MPLSLSFVGVLLFDIASPGCGVVLLDDAPGVMLPLDELLLAPGVEDDVPEVDDDELPVDGVVELLDGDDELLVAGLVVDGLIVPVLLDDEGDVLLGAVLLDDELVEGGDELLSRWQPATPIAAATARTAQGFGFMVNLRSGYRRTVSCPVRLAESVP